MCAGLEGVVGFLNKSNASLCRAAPVFNLPSGVECKDGAARVGPREEKRE